MAKPNILVVDSDEGFGFMLKDGLQNTGQYTAIWSHTGSDALQAIGEQSFDLVIIDIGLSDMKPEKLVKAIRQANNGIKIMMIPFIGDTLPDHMEKLELNGVLPKPFFVGDLPELVDKAMGREPSPSSSSYPVQAPVAAPNDTPTTVEQTTEPSPPPSVAVTPAPEMGIPIVPQETIRFLRASEAEILRLLSDLNLEVRAEAILLVAGTNLISHAGMLDRGHCEELAVLVAQSTQAASQAAQFLGERAGRFTQSLHEGGAYRLYTLTLHEGVLLSLALSTNVPLGMIRHQCRQIAEQLGKYII